MATTVHPGGLEGATVVLSSTTSAGMKAECNSLLCTLGFISLEPSPAQRKRRGHPKIGTGRCIPHAISLWFGTK